ncbi:matrixin family metalloprotease [Nocardioides panacis]|uniref:Matrixin family metalloprotease n=1 Tax=Nocardioides panacis TaxID=2849501 RepID=A0A975SYH4_9ACTN|nr:matrixin family metalloprotease [Nocardioides panacis]QWZ08305.1 matrixin family metalloprotease [Nocardioides panacis]QWZ08332.1 matrixin family metalloprotease [Nocardioides panacis]
MSITRTVMAALTVLAALTSQAPLDAASHGTVVVASSSVDLARYGSPAVPRTASARRAATRYSFLNTDDLGRPARWNPCKPITWRYNPARQRGASDLRDVRASVARLAAATGLRYVYAGTTSDQPYRPQKGNSTDEDLLIGWGNQATLPDLAGSVAGYGGTTTRYQISADGVRGPQEIVSAQLVLDHDGAALAPGLGHGYSLGALVLHELGHTAGLGHSAFAGDVMYPNVNGAFTGGYAAGDLAGLRLLGATNGCFASPLR